MPNGEADMTNNDLTQAARQLEARIAAAGAATRFELQPELSRVLEKLSRQGEHVPARLRNLNAVLLDEAIEQRFDNLPV